MNAWTDREIDALIEAVGKYKTDWNEIKKAYGPDGNGRLSARTSGVRIAHKARFIAKKLYDSGESLGVFQSVCPRALNREPVPKKPIAAKEPWTDAEVNALVEAVGKYKQDWRRIKQEYGPGGNGLLSARVDGVRIANKARWLAKQLYDDGEDMGVFSCMETPALKLPRTRKEWTLAQDGQLLYAAQVHGTDYPKFAEMYPELQEHDVASIENRLSVLKSTPRPVPVQPTLIK